MKIAIFHNFMDNIGGAEYVDLLLAKEIGADIYTTNIDKDKIKKMGFGDVLDRIYSIGKVPVNAPFRQEKSYWLFKNLDVEKDYGKKYDYYFIGGDWAVYGAINNKPNLWYVYSPIREIWDLNKYVRKEMVSWWKRPIFDLWVLLNRKRNRNAVKEVGKIIAISKNVALRVKKYLGKDAKVIYPPTEIGKFHCERNKGYWLSVNRLINHKRVKMQVEAFRKMPSENLVIVGSYEKSGHFKKYAEEILKDLPKNVSVKSWVSEKELIDLYANCKGFITTSKEEDYGMNVVEAMASGKFVIAPNEGGYKETIINGKTGVLIDNIDESKIISAVKKYWGKTMVFKNECIKRAKEYDVSVFLKNIKKELSSL